MSEKEYEAPRPTAYCSLSNSSEIDCDSCRLKPPITYRGVDYFCIAPIIERRYFEEMKERNRNISISWGNNFLVESRVNRNDTLDAVAGLGVGVEGKENQPLVTLGAYDEKDERGTITTSFETEDVVGEAYRG